MNKLIDSYNLRAKLFPACLTMLPLLFGLLAWVPNIKGLTEPITSAAVAAGVLFILMYIAHDAGKNAERKLITEWGGFLPSVLMLRHRDTSIDSVTKARYHSKLQRIIDQIHMPTPAEEAQNQVNADEQYLSCCKFLLQATRDEKKFPLVKEENMNYGFRRNLFGLRPYGFASSSSGIIVSGVKLCQIVQQRESINSFALYCFIACVLFLLGWIFVVSKAFVRSGADAYALRLLETVEGL